MSLCHVETGACEQAFEITRVCLDGAGAEAAIELKIGGKFSTISISRRGAITPSLPSRVPCFA